MLELQDMGVHEERLARAGRALKGEGAQVVRFIVRHGCSQPLPSLDRVQVGAQRFGVGEITIQVMFGEQQGKVLIRLPFPVVFTGHAQPAAMRREVSVVCRELVRRDCAESRVQIQRPGVFGLAIRVEADWRAIQPVQHGPYVFIAELPADEAVQDEAVLEGHIPRLATARRHQQNTFLPSDKGDTGGLCGIKGIQRKDTYNTGFTDTLLLQ